MRRALEVNLLAKLGRADGQSALLLFRGRRCVGQSACREHLLAEMMQCDASSRAGTDDTIGIDVNRTVLVFRLGTDRCRNVRREFLVNTTLQRLHVDVVLGLSRNSDDSESKEQDGSS